jgi:hypothetical protein
MRVPVPVPVRIQYAIGAVSNAIIRLDPFCGCASGPYCLNCGQDGARKRWGLGDEFGDDQAALEAERGIVAIDRNKIMRSSFDGTNPLPATPS